jgi:hypothetical protein
MEELIFDTIRGSAILAATLALTLLGLLATTPAQAQSFRACVVVTGTDDGMVQDAAMAGARESLEDAIAQWRRENPGVNPVRSAERPKPNPYWRDSVDPELYFKPDIVEPDTYTVCWRGVVSPVVCTAGARLCY